MVLFLSITEKEERRKGSGDVIAKALSGSRSVLLGSRSSLPHNTMLCTYGIVTGASGPGPSSLDPSQKQSRGVMMAHGIIISNIWKK